MGNPVCDRECDHGLPGNADGSVYSGNHPPEPRNGAGRIEKAFFKTGEASQSGIRPPGKSQSAPRNSDGQILSRSLHHGGWKGNCKEPRTQNRKQGAPLFSKGCPIDDESAGGSRRREPGKSKSSDRASQGTDHSPRGNRRGHFRFRELGYQREPDFFCTSKPARSSTGSTWKNATESECAPTILFKWIDTKKISS